MTTGDSPFVAAISMTSDSAACWTALSCLARSVAGHGLCTATMAGYATDCVASIETQPAISVRLCAALALRFDTQQAGPG